MSELQPTYGNFVLRGIVGGTQSDKFFSEGKSNGNDWRRLNFSVKVNDNASIFVEMMGSKSDTVKLVDNSDKKNKKEYTVKWADRYKERKDKAEIFMASKVGLVKEEGGEKNKVISMTQFDAVKYIKDHLKEGDSVQIRGSLSFNVYEGKGQVKYIIKQIYHTTKAIDFKEEGFEPESSFNQNIVFVGTDYVEETNKTAVNTYVIYKEKGDIKTMPYMFFINHEKYKEDPEKTAALKQLKESFDNLPFGSTINVTGNINIYVEKETEEAEDNSDSIPDFGGFQAKGQETYITGTTIRELEITSGEGKTLIKERYNEEDFVPTANPFPEESGNNFGGFSGGVTIEEDDLPF